MARVETTVEEIEMEGDHGPVDGVCVTCERCGHSEEAFGTGRASAKRAAVMLRENCPMGVPSNFYVVDWDDDGREARVVEILSQLGGKRT